MSSTHLTVAAVVEMRGRFLFVEELAGGRQVINQPAGHVEPGETFVAAVIREMQEETAWKFTPAAINGVYLWHHPETDERFLRVTFCGSCHNHNAKQPLDDGIIRTLWLTRDEAAARDNALRSPMVMRALDDYQAGVRYPVNMFQQIGIDELANHAQRVV
jgi:ADP-ribose pyrophosphatase YjhB (NUDIX family)